MTQRLLLAHPLQMWNCFRGLFMVECSGSGPFDCRCSDGTTFASDTCAVDAASANAACGYDIPE
jgi:hypothetical protein